MQRSIVLVLALVAAVGIALVAFLVLSGPGARPSAAEPEDGGSHGAGSAGTSSAARDAADHGAAENEVALSRHDEPLALRASRAARGRAPERHVFAPPSRLETEPLIVQVSTKDHGPVPNADVEAWDEPWGGFDLPWQARHDRFRLLTRARTNAQGVARLPVPAGASIELCVGAPGAAVVWSDIGVNRDVKIPVILRAQPLEVLVLDASGTTPNADAFFEVLQPRLLARGLVDARGAARFSGRSANDFVYLAGSLLHGFWMGPAPEGTPPIGPVRLRAQPNAALQPIVADARTGAPIEAVTVHLYGAPETAIEIPGAAAPPLFLPLATPAPTSEPGRRDFSGSPASVELIGIVVRASGRAPAVAIRRAGSIAPSSPRLDLAEAAVARGRILAGGHPAHGVHLALLSATSRELVFDLPLRLAESGADGRFAFEDVDPRAHYRWIANGEERGRALGELAPLGDARTIDLGDIEIAPESQLRVTVVNEAGEPLPGIGVALTFGPGSVPRKRTIEFPLKLEHVGESSPDGQVVLPGLIAGEYVLAASVTDQNPAASRRAVTTNVSVKGSGADQVVNLVVPDAFAIEGRVVDWNGRSVPSSSVALAGSTLGRWGWPEMLRLPDGRFRIYPLPAGRHELEARAPVGLRIDGLEPGIARSQPIAAGSKDAELRLQPVVTITGVVVDASGMAVPHACVWAERPGEPIVDTIVSDSLGLFTLQPLGDAPVDLRACWTALRPGSATQRISVNRESAAVLATAVRPGASGIELRLTAPRPPPPKPEDVAPPPAPVNPSIPPAPKQD